MSQKSKITAAMVLGLVIGMCTACASSAPTPAPTRTLPPPTSTPVPLPTSTPETTATQPPSPIPPTATPDSPIVGTLTQTEDSECSFEPAVGPFLAGEVGITIVASNTGNFNLWRLAEDYTYEEFREFIEEEGQQPNPKYTGLRNLDVKPNSTTTVYVTLLPGTHAFVCSQRVGSFEEPTIPAGPFVIEE